MRACGHAAPVIELKLSSYFGQHKDFEATSAKPNDEVPTVYLPIVMSIDIDLSRGRPVSLKWRVRAPC